MKTNFVDILAKDRIISDKDLKIAKYEYLKKKFDQNIFARKYFIGAKHCVWNKIKKIMQHIERNLNILKDIDVYKEV